MFVSSFVLFCHRFDEPYKTLIHIYGDSCSKLQQCYKWCTLDFGKYIYLLRVPVLRSQDLQVDCWTLLYKAGGKSGNTYNTILNVAILDCDIWNIIIIKCWQNKYRFWKCVSIIYEFATLKCIFAVKCLGGSRFSVRGNMVSPVFHWKSTVWCYVCVLQVELTGSSFFDYVHHQDRGEVAEQLGIQLPQLTAGLHSPPMSDDGSSSSSTTGDKREFHFNYISA